MKNKFFILTLALSFGLLSCNQAGASSADLSLKQKNTDGISNSQDDKKVIDKPIKLTKADFLKKVMDYETNSTTWVYKGDKPCIIDFWADWCGPCKKAAPVLEEIAKEYAGDIYIYKVNTDQERELAGVFGIRNIPAFLFVPMKGKPQMSSGIARTPKDTKKMFVDLIDEILFNKEKEK